MHVSIEMVGRNVARAEMLPSNATHADDKQKKPKQNKKHCERETSLLPENQPEKLDARKHKMRSDVYRMLNLSN